MSNTPECECPECGGPRPNECGGYYCSEERGHIDCKPALFETQVKTLISMCVDKLNGGITEGTFIANLKLIVKFLEEHKS